MYTSIKINLTNTTNIIKNDVIILVHYNKQLLISA